MSRLAGTQYPIGSPTRVCAATGQPLNIGDRYIAALCQSRESDDFVRLDFSEAAWREGKRPDPGLILLGFWRATVSDGADKRPLLIDDESLLELFEQSGESSAGDPPAPELLAFRFILALILLRKRLLVHEGSRGPTMLVRARGSPKPPEGPALMEVADPGLTQDLIARVTEQLKAVLNDAAPTDARNSAPTRESKP